MSPSFPKTFGLSVSGRVLLFTVVVWVGLLLGMQGMLSRVFRPTFVDIESKLLIKDLERIEAAVDREAEQLGATARDYASWRDMRMLVMADDADASLENSRVQALDPEVLRTLDLDAIFVFDAVGRPKQSLHSHSEEELREAREYTPQGFAAEFPVIATARTSSGNSSRRGLVRFKEGRLVFAAAAPVVATGPDAQVLGTVVMLRELDAQAVNRLGEQVRLRLVLESAEVSGLAPRAADAAPVVSEANISASAWLRDPFGTPIARFSVSRPANILLQGEETLHLGAVGSLVVLSLVLFLLLLLLQWSIVRPLRALGHSMETVRRTGDLDHRGNLKRADEIGLLSDNFDRLLALLSERTKVLEALATTDGLTGLLNRRTIMEYLEAQLEEARATGCELSVLLLDVDHFKKINDTAGHGVGDRVLRQVAAILKKCVRCDERAGRYGGEEFLIVLPKVDRDQVLSAAERARDAIACERIQGLDWNVTVSVGVGCLREGITAHGLLATADLNLYRAKETGRDRVIADEIPLSRLPAASIPPPDPRLPSVGPALSHKEPRIVNG